MKITVYSKEGKESGSTTLPKEIFEVELNKDLLHQVVVSQASNRRQGNAHTKDRSDVRGGGRKPWAQKGTGRARHGSRRSPIWIGGGVTFGPRNDKSYKKIVPKKIRIKALFITLSEKVKAKNIIILDELKDVSKTKDVQLVLNNLKIKGSALIALPEMNKELIRSVNNISKIDTIQAKDLNAFDIMQHKTVIMPKDSIKVIKETFSL